MKTTMLTAGQIGKRLKKLISESDDFYWAVAWGSDGPLADELVANRKKIRNIVVGIDFSQTDPRLLERLAPTEGARVAVNNGEGIFHPKTYYFQSGKKAAAIIGSANFTRAGTTVNTEAALLLEGAVDDEPLSSIRAMVESIWERSSAIDKDFLTSYKLQYSANRKHRDALKKPLRINRAGRQAIHADLLTKSWQDYVTEIHSSPKDELDRRLNVLRKAQSLLNSVDKFSELELDERKAIAGVNGRGEVLRGGLDSYGWGWFGSMFGAGSFRNRIAENDPFLSRALEHIPPTGEVTQEDYAAFIYDFTRAFKDSARQGGVPTATRLLAMKRPDYFVCVDGKNAKLMSADLGFARTTLNFEKYWTEVIEPITQSAWWQVRRPSGVEGRIWDGRAAMLDAIYYDRS